jgi:hypothetical protein
MNQTLHSSGNSTPLEFILTAALTLGLGFIIIAITLLPFWFIFKKAGFHPAISLLTAIPIVNILTLYYIAFSPWPALKDTKIQS